MTSDIFNLKKQFVIYGAHHNNKVNVAIHMVFVPTILWTGKNSLWDAYFFCLNWLFLEALVFASNTGPLLDVKGTIFEFLSPFGPNLAFFVVVFYLIYYAILDPIAAVKKKKKRAFLQKVIILMSNNRHSFLQSSLHSAIQQPNSCRLILMLTKSPFTFTLLLGFSNSLDTVLLKREARNCWIM